MFSWVSIFGIILLALLIYLHLDNKDSTQNKTKPNIKPSKIGRTGTGPTATKPKKKVRFNPTPTIFQYEV